MNKCHFIVILFFISLVAGCQQEAANQPQQREHKPMDYIKTFKIKTCDKIIIESYKKASYVKEGKKAEVTEINDQQIIDKVLALLNQLPDQGDMMIKMGNSPLLKVILVRGDNMEYFNYYSQLLKTPDTSFYSEAPPEVEQLYNLLRDQL